MTNNADYADFTSVYSRAMAQLTQSPVTNVVAGWHTQVFDVQSWARSLNLLITVPANVLTLSVVGVSTGFTYLNGVPVYDGGIYYIPAMPVIDTQVTVSWYQVTATSTALYIVASDEPISVSMFNAINPTVATVEDLSVLPPQNCTPNSTTTVIIPIDVTTNAVRVTADVPASVLWGKVTGNQSGRVYYDGSATNTTFPSTPIPVDRTVDTSISAQVRTTVAGSLNLYIALINSPDYSASVPLSQAMTAHDIGPSVRQSELPNQPPLIYEGTIPLSGDVLLLSAIAGRQYRVHAITVTQYTAVATAFELQDTAGLPFWRYHYGAAMNALAVSLFGQLVRSGLGFKLHNTTAVLSGSVAVTLWYSVL